jgi:hypothetical protein
MKYTLYFSALFMSALPLFASTEEDMHNALSLKENKQHNALKDIDLDLPQFSIIGKNHKFYIGIGGSVTVTAGFDWGHVLDNPNEFIPAEIPMNTDAGNGGKFSVSAQQTDLHLTFGFLPGTKDHLTGYINGQFLGDNYNFRLENAWIKYRGFTVGYGYGIFSNHTVEPTTIDYQGPNATICVNNGILDYEHTFKHWAVGIGAETPIASYTDGTDSYKVNQRVPDIPAYIQYNYCTDSRIRVAAIIRTLTYRNTLESKNISNIGWGVQVNGKSNIIGNLTAYYQFGVGKGISSYFNDLNDGDLDMVPDANNPGKMNTVLAWGGYAGLQYDFTSHLSSTIIYSHMRDYAKRYNDAATDALSWAEQYKYGQYILANIFYTITPNLTWAIEYIYGRRVNMDRSQAHDNRLQTMLQLNF